MNKEDKKKVEEWAKQQAKYTEEILFLRDLIIDNEKEIKSKIEKINKKTNQNIEEELLLKNLLI